MAPFIENLLSQSESFLPFGILAASLVGSGHCVAMCGGIAFSASEKPSGATAYHLIRGMMYILYGAAAGSVGNIAFHQSPIFAAFVFISMAIYFLPIPFFDRMRRRFFSIGKPLKRTPWLFSAFLGLANGLLPCGWLLLFVSLSSVSKSPAQGAIIMAFFWLGTIPALATSHFVFQWLSQKAIRIHPSKGLGLSTNAKRWLIAGSLLVFSAVNLFQNRRSELTTGTFQVQPACHIDGID